MVRDPRTFRPAECDLALLSASEIYGSAAGVCMWQTDGGIEIVFFSPLFLTHSLFLATYWFLSHRFTSPNKTCHSATVSTHTLDPALLTQPSFCLLNSTFHKHYPQWTLQTIPVTFSLSCGSSNHATHCVTFQSTSQRSQFLTDPCVSFQFSRPFQTNDLWST